jgi:hypothetical protein
MLDWLFFLAALIVFLLELFGVHASFSLTALGLAFLAAGLLVGRAGTYWDSRRTP